VLGLVGVAALVVVIDPGRVTRTLLGADPLLLLLMLPIVLALHVLHGVAWGIALRGAGVPVGTPEAVRVTYISQAFDVLPGGDLWRIAVVRPEHPGRLDAGAVAASVVFDDLVYFLVLSLAMVPAAIRLPFLRAALAAVLAPQLAIFLILLWPALYRALAAPVERLRPFRRFAPQLRLLGPSFRRLVRPRTLVPVVLVDAFCAALAITLYWLALSAVHVRQVGPYQVGFTYAGGQVLAGLTVLPGALGVYEGLMTAAIALQGVPPALAAAGALIYRAVNDLLMALIGLAVALRTDRSWTSRRRSPLSAQAPPGVRPEPPRRRGARLRQ
jgi:uncharacterized membrane protein YbhN (UPF0104 family)